MTRDEIIRMARDAGFDESNAVCAVVVRHSNGSWVGIEERLVSFAALVAAAERATISELLDRLEVAEKERDVLRDRLALESQENGALRDSVDRACEERDNLRAKITEMEKQPPICRIKDIRRAHYMTKVVGLDPEAWLYAPPGAQTQPAPSVPEPCPCCGESLRVYSRCSNRDCEAVTITPEQARYNKVLAFSRTVATRMEEPCWPMLSDGHLRAICFAYEKGFAAGVDERNTTNVFGASGSQAAAFDIGLECGRAAQNRVQPAQSVPDGWQLVPKQATQEMVRACASAARAYMQEFGGNSPHVMWSAMLAAAPEAKP